MAHQSHHDVVTQSQSADAHTFADASATKTTDFAARAAIETLSTSTLQSPANLSQTLSDHQHDSNLSSNDLVSVEGLDYAVDAELQQPITHSENKTNGLVDAAEIRDSEAFEEGSVKSAGMEGSIGSDTDASRADIAGLASKDSEGRDAIPRYAAKKSASFKPVSVTKNFLAKAGSVSIPTKPGLGNEKINTTPGNASGSSAQLIARPRLVAKSASGQRGVAPKMVDMTAKPGKGSGPDPNQVWNKNRVSAPQATPKHLTDEELRLQYGIQLASRPQEDADGKEAKWADIDDDEDDWAPETIEWNDGTKINLAQIEKDAAAAEQLAAQKVKEAQEREAEAMKSRQPPSKPTAVGPNATVLKLGASVQQKSLTLGAKNNAEKPTLVAKPFTPATVKSPWAPLPAVDKVSPVQISPQVQPEPARLGQRNPHGFESMPPPPAHHAKEIAADDFSRFSRDSPNGVPRELFVPQSGRYEPVNDSRRQSFRKDGNFRQPSLLQRPSPGDQHGPAEPSAAFQTHRSQQDSVSWTRRRASSTVSGESGNIARRMSIGRGLDSPRTAGEVRPRRDSQYDQSNPAPSMGSTMGSQREASPVQSHGRSIASPSPTTSFPPEATTNAAVPDRVQQAPNDGGNAVLPNNATNEDAVVVQKRLMREKREAAIKRKKDEEEKEEAERRERIRLKMEKLGLTDDKMGKKNQSEPTHPIPKQVSKDSKEGLPKVPESPPKPPVPNATGLPQQYGLIKVHASQPTNALILNPTPSVERSAVQAPLDTEMKSVEKAADVQPTVMTTEAEKPVDERESVTERESIAKDAITEPRQWSNLQQQAPNSYQNWGGSSMTTHSSPGGNLWGPPSHHRALGNGDFQQNLQRTSLRTSQPPYAQHLTSITPQPIGTPRQYQQNRGPTAHAKNDLLANSIVEDSQTIPAFPSPEPDSLPVGDQLRREPSSNIQINDHPQAQASAPASVMSEPSTLEQPKTGIAAWAHFGANVGRQEAEKAAQEHAARVAAQQLGISRSPQLPVLNETWKQVKRGEGSGTRQLVATVRAQNNYAPTIPPQPSTADLNKATNTPSVAPHVRSRYQDIFEQNQRAVSVPPSLLRSYSPSAPPPDSLDHPAYVGLSERPLVNLPGARPKMQEKPVVKLPPTKASPELQRPSTAVDSTASSASNRAVSQPLVSNPSWQDRFNGLFDRDRKHSPEKRFANVADFSASKEPLELNLIGSAKAVTLPPHEDSVDGPKQIVVKNVEDEDALFEERDFGSVPITRIPAMAPASAWTPAKEPVHLQKRAKILALRDTDILSIPYALNIHDDQIRSNGFQISILLLGMATAKMKSMSRAGINTPSRGPRPQSTRAKHRQGNKPREASSPLGPKSGQAGVGRTPAPSGNIVKARPSHGGGNASWARKASGVVT